ncbi:MAG: hypothetical protein KC572_09400 [Gammaproteobacteria bacterium]|nr:hypothetical protein [Gammaproteobacteria bacterium]
MTISTAFTPQCEHSPYDTDGPANHDGRIASPAFDKLLISAAANGNETSFAETWEFVDNTHFNWKLTSEFPDAN